MEAPARLFDTSPLYEAPVAVAPPELTYQEYLDALLNATRDLVKALGANDASMAAKALEERRWTRETYAHHDRVARGDLEATNYLHGGHARVV